MSETSSSGTNKATVDYTSPALCTPVIPSRRQAMRPIVSVPEEERSHGHRRHAQKFGKDRAWGSGDILSDRQTDRPTDRRTHHNTLQPLPQAK